MILKREELIKACKGAGFRDPHWAAMTYKSGPYSITEPTYELIRLAEILTNKTFDRNS